LAFSRKRSDPPPKTKSKTPPTYAVQAAAVWDVSPKTNGVMKRITPSAAVIQSCQRISLDIANQPPTCFFVPTIHGIDFRLKQRVADGTDARRDT
jgi:hypothetical protein